MMCAFCKGQDIQCVLKKYVVALDEMVLIVNNVPSLECVQCGENFYTDEVSEVLEKITNKAKTIPAEILVANFEESNKIEVVR